MPVEELEAELAALKAENERMKPGPGHHCYWTDYGERQKQRAEQAEAKLAALRARNCGCCHYEARCDIQYAAQAGAAFRCSAWEARP